MKKIILSIVLTIGSVSILAMEKKEAAPAKSAEALDAKKSGAEVKSNDVTQVKADKDATQKHGLLSCLLCHKCKEK